MMGTAGPGGCKDRLIVASSFIGSMRYRLVTADELKSITPLHQKKEIQKLKLQFTAATLAFKLLQSKAFSLNLFSLG